MIALRSRPKLVQTKTPQWGPDTLAMDKLAHHKGAGHAAQTLSCKPVDSRTLSSDTPVAFRTPGSEGDALVVSRTPSGWLYDRAEGLRAHTRSNTENRDCAQPRAPIYKGLGESVWKTIGSDLSGGITQHIISRATFPTY